MSPVDLYVLVVIKIVFKFRAHTNRIYSYKNILGGHIEK